MRKKERRIRSGKLLAVATRDQLMHKTCLLIDCEVRERGKSVIASTFLTKGQQKDAVAIDQEEGEADLSKEEYFIFNI